MDFENGRTWNAQRFRKGVSAQSLLAQHHDIVVMRIHTMGAAKLDAGFARSLQPLTDILDSRRVMELSKRAEELEHPLARHR
jgi:hypothetical protein